MKNSIFIWNSLSFYKLSSTRTILCFVWNIRSRIIFKDCRTWYSILQPAATANYTFDIEDDTTSWAVLHSLCEIISRKLKNVWEKKKRRWITFGSDFPISHSLRCESGRENVLSKKKNWRRTRTSMKILTSSPISVYIVFRTIWQSVYKRMHAVRYTSSPRCF